MRLPIDIVHWNQTQFFPGIRVRTRIWIRYESTRKTYSLRSKMSKRSKMFQKWENSKSDYGYGYIHLNPSPKPEPKTRFFGLFREFRTDLDQFLAQLLKKCTFDRVKWQTTQFGCLLRHIACYELGFLRYPCLQTWLSFKAQNRPFLVKNEHYRIRPSTIRNRLDFDHFFLLHDASKFHNLYVRSHVMSVKTR